MFRSEGTHCLSLLGVNKSGKWRFPWIAGINPEVHHSLFEPHLVVQDMIGV